jgi:predicted TIM-barrel fold metal-dependent hydrolase
VREVKTSGPIIDAHAHITAGIHGRTAAGSSRSLTHGQVRWGDDVFQFLPPMNPGLTVFLPETLLHYMDWAGVDHAVLLQGPFYGEQNALLGQAVARWPDRFSAAGHVDPRAADAKEQFRRCTDEYGFGAIKMELSDATGFCGIYPDLQLRGPELEWFWEEAEKKNIVVTLDLGKPGGRSYQTQSVEAIAALHPQLRIVIAHLGQPPIGRPEESRLAKLWEEQILLGRHPNVWFDVSALPAYNDESYPYERAAEYVRRAIRLLPPDKLMWGSDVPGLLGVATYGQLLHFLDDAPFAGQEGIARFLGGAAAQVYSIGQRTTDYNRAGRVAGSVRVESVKEEYSEEQC